MGVAASLGERRFEGLGDVCWVMRAHTRRFGPCQAAPPIHREQSEIKHAGGAPWGPEMGVVNVNNRQWGKGFGRLDPEWETEPLSLALRGLSPCPLTTVLSHCFDFLSCFLLPLAVSSLAVCFPSFSISESLVLFLSFYPSLWYLFHCLSVSLFPESLGYFFSLCPCLCISVSLFLSMSVSLSVCVCVSQFLHLSQPLHPYLDQVLSPSLAL